MITNIVTPRLSLQALTPTQLRWLLSEPAKLEDELGYPVAKEIIDANVVRAINMKLGKMAQVNPGLHVWFTYWLITVKVVPLGVGLIGFKGSPGPDGKAEVGYGIDPAYRNWGLMTEALMALSEWALKRPECRGLTATTVKNPASERVLQKAGWRKVKQDDKSSDWEKLK